MDRRSTHGGIPNAATVLSAAGAAPGSDTGLPHKMAYLMVQTAGNLEVTFQGQEDSEKVVIPVPVGMTVGRFAKVFTANSTAQGVTAFYFK